MNASPTAAILRSRSGRWFLLAAALVALLVPPAVAEAKKRPSCKPKHSKTVALNEAIRVYRIHRRKGDVTRTYACRTKTGRRIRMSSLGVENDIFDVGTSAYRIQLRGRFVAYGLKDVDDARAKAGAPIPGDKVLRIDITRRHGRKTLATTPNFATLKDIALTERGAVAWIVKNNVPPPTSYVVALADAAGTRTLAAGTDIARGSLAMSRSFVYWKRAGSAFARKLTY